MAVEGWLKQLRRVTGERLADATKAKIRNLMSVLFNDAIRYEWLEQARNPITLVRQSAQRKWTPEILEPHEIQNLLLQLNSCSRREAQTQAVFELRAIPVSTSATVVFFTQAALYSCDDYSFPPLAAHRAAAALEQRF